MNLEVLRSSLPQPTMFAKLSSVSDTLRDQDRMIFLPDERHSVHGAPNLWTWKSPS